jgi:tetratricopeptide (TPR) repeat protein
MMARLLPFRSPVLLAAALVAGLFLVGCESSLVATDPGGGLSARIEATRQALNQTPGNAALQRDLGVLYLRAGQPQRADTLLTQAIEQDADDPKTLYYLGLVREKRGATDRALDLFDRYEDVPDSSRFRDLLRGRYEQLRRQTARADIQSRIQREEEIGLGGVDPEAVAVFPLRYEGEAARFVPLGRGLAEMILSDLASVERLTVVERVRLQALRRELELARSDYIDPETAPRVGRLIGAGRLVGGSYDVTPERTLQLNVTLTAIRGPSPAAVRPSGDLEQLFRLANDVVFQLVDQLGITLTAEERAAIEQVPTENLEAFLAYSRALEEEDRGNYQRAAALYRQAAQADPDLQGAQQGARRTEATAAASGSVAEAAAAGAGGPTQALNLNQLRLNNLGASGRLGAGDRQPAAEFSTGDALLLDGAPDLPERQGGGS